MCALPNALHVVLCCLPGCSAGRRGPNKSAGSKLGKLGARCRQRHPSAGRGHHPASRQRDHLLLRQSVLGTGGDSAWNVFGWVYVYEWAPAAREVVSMEGDVSTIALLSNKYVPLVTQAQALEVTKNACQYLWAVSVVVAFMLVLVGVLVLVQSVFLRGRVVGRNFFHFNRMAGGVWLGRSLLLVRGTTAVILLSTSRASLESTRGLTSFRFDARSWFQSMLVAGEATWISYVVHDCVVVWCDARCWLRVDHPTFAQLRRGCSHSLWISSRRTP
ncbi:unnamed protein product [Aphanomyces euteiches]